MDRLSPDAARAGCSRTTNVVRVQYVNDYDRTGDGFHRFVDPEDGEEYVYTNFEPYEAHRLFPCFDQPDIKGRYTFTVTAPADWLVLANSPVESSDATDDGRTRHRFAQTELFSSYLVALVGGPYVARRVDHNGLQLGLFARRSMERYLEEQSPEIFELTGQGLDFYADLFAQPYPFAKYDQIFVPEYNSGAMENVGLVTYNEAYLFRDPATINERLDRGETFLHELAHMWFGNLVTMRWWDDLWLNESFATYISYLALTEATRFTNAWKVFNADIKRWAYQTDQLPTTHPIAGAADDTEIAFLIFDGITYGKGASVLKQLVKYIGPDAFRDGMRLYFRRHGWSNATLEDFLTCLEEGSGRDLDEWAQLWLRTASLNTLAAEWHAEDGRVTSLSIGQSAPADHPTFASRTRSRWLSRGAWRVTTRSIRSRPGSMAPKTEIPEGPRARRATARLPELRRPRLRQDLARSAIARVRAQRRRPHRRPAPAVAPVDVDVGDGPRPPAALDRVPGHRPQPTIRRAGSGHPRHRPRARRADDLAATCPRRCARARHIHGSRQP